MKYAGSNIALATTEQKAALAIEVLEPEYQTAAMMQWAADQIVKGFEIRDVQLAALQNQQQYIQRQLAVMAQNSHAQNALLMQLAKTQELQAAQTQQQLELMHQNQLVLAARLTQNDTNHENRLKALENEPKTVEYITNNTTVTVGDNFRGVINAESSNSKQQSGWGGFIVALAIALVIFGMLSGRRFTVMGDGSVLVQDNCARIEKSGSDYICRDK